MRYPIIHERTLADLALYALTGEGPLRVCPARGYDSLDDALRLVGGAPSLALVAERAETDPTPTGAVLRAALTRRLPRAPSSPRCACCDRALDGDHLAVRVHTGALLTYCPRGCRRPTAHDLATSTARTVRAGVQP